MNGVKERNNSNDTKLHDGFHGMKCHRRPRRWVGREMMNPVKIFKEARVMHQSMCPIKIGIVQKEGQRYRKNEITYAMCMDISVDKCVFCQRAEKK